MEYRESREEEQYHSLLAKYQYYYLQLHLYVIEVLDLPVPELAYPFTYRLLKHSQMTREEKKKKSLQNKVFVYISSEMNETQYEFYTPYNYDTSGKTCRI
jgi:hypothetical protein